MSRSGRVSGAARKPTVASAATLALFVSFSTLAAALTIAWSESVSAHRFSTQPPSLGTGQQFVYHCYSERYCSWYETAENIWNAQPGTPSFQEVSSNEFTSLIITRDRDDANITTALAEWNAGPSPDEIWNHYPNMRNLWVDYGNKTYRLVATHEFGHAVGLHHPELIEGNNDKNWHCKSIMYGNARASLKCGQTGYLLQHDENDWVALWGTD